MAELTFRQKAANILRNFHRNTKHPECDEGDLNAALDALDRARATSAPRNMMDTDYEKPSIVVVDTLSRRTK